MYACYGSENTTDVCETPDQMATKRAATIVRQLYTGLEIHRKALEAHPRRKRVESTRAKWLGFYYQKKTFLW